LNECQINTISFVATRMLARRTIPLVFGRGLCSAVIESVHIDGWKQYTGGSGTKWMEDLRRIDDLLRIAEHDNAPSTTLNNIARQHKSSKEKAFSIMEFASRQMLSSYQIGTAAVTQGAIEMMEYIQMSKTFQRYKCGNFLLTCLLWMVRTGTSQQVQQAMNDFIAYVNCAVKDQGLDYTRMLRTGDVMVEVIEELISSGNVHICYDLHMRLNEICPVYCRAQFLEPMLNSVEHHASDELCNLVMLTFNHLMTSKNVAVFPRRYLDKIEELFFAIQHPGLAEMISRHNSKFRAEALDHALTFSNHEEFIVHGLRRKIREYQVPEYILDACKEFERLGCELDDHDYFNLFSFLQRRDPTDPGSQELFAFIFQKFNESVTEPPESVAVAIISCMMHFGLDDQVKKQVVNLIDRQVVISNELVHTILRAYANKKSVALCNFWLRFMEQVGLSRTQETYLILIQMYCDLNDLKTALELIETAEEAGLIGFSSSVNRILSKLLEMESFERAYEFFKSFLDSIDAESANFMLGNAIIGGHDAAVSELCSFMTLNGLAMDYQTIVKSFLASGIEKTKMVSSVEQCFFQNSLSVNYRELTEALIAYDIIEGVVESTRKVIGCSIAVGVNWKQKVMTYLTKNKRTDIAMKLLVLQTRTVN
jgi:hypothetical protein